MKKQNAPDELNEIIVRNYQLSKSEINEIMGDVIEIPDDTQEYFLSASSGCGVCETTGSITSCKM